MLSTLLWNILYWAAQDDASNTPPALTNAWRLTLVNLHLLLLHESTRICRKMIYWYAVDSKLHQAYINYNQLFTIHCITRHTNSTEQQFNSYKVNQLQKSATMQIDFLSNQHRHDQFKRTSPWNTNTTVNQTLSKWQQYSSLWKKWSLNK